MSEQEGTRSLYRIVNIIIGSYFNLISDIVKIFHLETALAKKSLSKIIACILLAAIILFSTWLSLLGLLLLYLIQLHYSWLIAVSAIAVLNIFILLIIIFIIMRLMGNLSFSATRRQISSLRNKETTNDLSKKSD